MRTSKLWLFALLFSLIPAAHAVQLGVNYYHESLVSQQWGVPYIVRTPTQVGQDFDHIREISKNIKFYMNPMVDANLPWIQTISALADQRGFSIVVNMMVDDRQLTSSNWNDYANKVASSCTALNGKVDSILVGNEITLHSPMSRTDIKNKVVDLINRCKQSFSGEVSYEEFWYAKDVWTGYSGPIYFMMYENFDSFSSNINELNSKFGSKGVIGEWGEDSIDEGVEKDDWWQRVEVEKRWNVIKATQSPVAYIFTYREPSWNAFGIIRPDGQDRPVWSYLKSLGFGSGTSTPPPTTCTPSTEVCDGRDNNCNGQTDENNVCAAPAPSTSGVNNLVLSCSVSGCSVASDVKSGCRTVTWNTPQGQIKVQGCDKSGGYVELYKQAAPSGLAYRACFANGCITQDAGYARFLPGTSTPPPTPTGPPPTGTGIAGFTFTSSPAGTKTADTLNGCRAVTYSTSAGVTSAKVCDKGSGRYELYLTAMSGSTSVCIGSNCVGPTTGFSAFRA